MTLLSVGAVLRQFLEPFLRRYKVPSRVVDTLKRLSRCHTGQLGWSLMQCQSCSKLHWNPNSCGDRHCPDCHHRQRELWLKKQRGDLLPVRYYHWVFTLPAQLRPLALQNQKLIYTLLYTHRVAITNSRLAGIHAHTVTFRYRNYRQDGQVQELSLAAVEFVRRLSLHILPPGFTKVRHYGLLGNNRRKKSLPLARAALENSSHRVDLSPVPPKLATWEPTPCDRCGGLDLRCLGRTDSAGKFSGILRGALRLRLRVGDPPAILNSS